MNKFIKTIEEEARKYLSAARGSHDFEHTMRVYNLCMHVGKKENADMKILQLSALLHDIGRKKEDELKSKKAGHEICHAELGAEMAAEILRKHKYDEERIEKIAHCIKTHRFRGKNIPESKEAKVLFDSDKLDGIGAVGVGRAFLFAGEIGAKLHNSDIDVSKTEEYSKEDTAYREFTVKLKHVKERMLTGEGKRIAEGRHKFMVGFFQRLDDEVAGDL